jgi:hypothetical protein
MLVDALHKNNLDAEIDKFTIMVLNFTINGDQLNTS